LPLLTSSLLALGSAHAMSSPCDLRIDDAAVAAIWVALVIGTGGVVTMASAGVHRVSDASAIVAIAWRAGRRRRSPARRARQACSWSSSSSSSAAGHQATAIASARSSPARSPARYGWCPMGTTVGFLGNAILVRREGLAADVKTVLSAAATLVRDT
jgi:hypothetical protein